MRIPLAIAAVIISVASAPIASAAPDGKGNNVTEPRSTEQPADPDAWGSATSQFAHTGRFGQHASSFPEPRQGVGNVAATDGGAGTRPSDHAFVVGPMAGIDPTLKPGG